MKKQFLSVLFLSVIISLFSTCKKESPVLQDSVFPRNKPPRANAGSDIVIVLPVDSVELNGSGTDEDGHIVSFTWRITGYHSQEGRYVAFNFRTSVAQLKCLEEGTYWCELMVLDNKGLSAKDEAVVSVVSNGCPCYPYPCDSLGDPCNPWDY